MKDFLGSVWSKKKRTKKILIFDQKPSTNSLAENANVPLFKFDIFIV